MILDTAVVFFFCFELSKIRFVFFSLFLGLFRPKLELLSSNEHV